MYFFYYKKEGEEIETYSDADWGGNKSDRKSISGSVTLYKGNIISWFSRKQSCVALSTTEAEYVAAAISACDLLNLKGLCYDFNSEKYSDKSEIMCVLYMDNIGAIEMTKSFENSKRAKHIDIKIHFIKDLTNKGELVVQYVQSDHNLADIFTKSLSQDKFINICLRLNIV